jgi:hypothetical protein
MRTIIPALLSLLLSMTASAKNMYIPAAGVTAGSNGTFWRTDLRIYNPSTVDEIDVTLHFLPQGVDGRNIAGRMFHIGKRETLVLDNVVATLAPELTNAVGAIRIDSDTYASFEFIVSSRTWTGTGDVMRPGTYGQFVPALDPADANRFSAVLHVASSPDVRTNLGVMNPGLEEVSVRMTLLGIDGKPFLESNPMTVPPRSMRQWSIADLFGALYAENGVVIIEATTPVFTWGSVVDNYSGDAIFVRGVANEAGVTPLQ